MSCSGLHRCLLLSQMVIQMSYQWRGASIFRPTVKAKIQSVTRMFMPVSTQLGRWRNAFMLSSNTNRTLVFQRSEDILTARYHRIGAGIIIAKHDQSHAKPAAQDFIDCTDFDIDFPCREFTLQYLRLSIHCCARSCLIATSQTRHSYSSTTNKKESIYAHTVMILIQFIPTIVHCDMNSSFLAQHLDHGLLNSGAHTVQVHAAVIMSVGSTTILFEIFVQLPATKHTMGCHAPYINYSQHNTLLATK